MSLLQPNNMNLKSHNDTSATSGNNQTQQWMITIQKKKTKNKLRDNTFPGVNLDLDFIFPSSIVSSFFFFSMTLTNTHTRADGEPNSPRPAPSWKDGNEPECC